MHMGTHTGTADKIWPDTLGRLRRLSRQDKMRWSEVVGCPREHTSRVILDAIFYIVSSGPGGRWPCGRAGSQR
jgi:hypothetical protein